MSSGSVIVCTFDRPELLARLLESLCRDGEDSASLPVLLVDNGGRTTTRAVYERFKNRLPLQWLQERRQGKSHALNAALEVAQGELLLFADDDVEVRAGWARAFVDAARDAPEAGWFGGRSIPKWGAGSPGWVARGVPLALRGYCCHYDLGDAPRVYEANDLLPIGACMAVRKSTFAAIGGYDRRLGPSGHDRGVGDDTELLMRAMARGIPGRYVPEAIVDHFVPAKRLKPGAVFRYGLIKGRQREVQAGRRADRWSAASQAASQAVRGLGQLLKRQPQLAVLCLLNVGLALGSALSPDGERSPPRT